MVYKILGQLLYIYNQGKVKSKDMDQIEWSFKLIWPFIHTQHKKRSLLHTQGNEGPSQPYVHALINRDYYMTIFISYPISTRDTHIPRADMGQGLIWGMIWKLAYHNLFIIHFSFWQVCLFDIVCGVKGKTTECSECGDMGFLPRQKKPYHHMTWWYGFFAQAKKSYYPCD